MECGCRTFPGVDVCGGLSHHAACHVWTLLGCYRGLHTDSGQNSGGKQKYIFTSMCATIIFMNQVFALW